jgi:hypothetical protein
LNSQKREARSFFSGSQSLKSYKTKNAEIRTFKF